jgi:hypothetical protein
MSNIKFIEESHQYLTEDDRVLISVSAFTDRFKEKVDWVAVAKKVAGKKTKLGEPTTTQEILAKWEHKRDESARIGTILHTIEEDKLIGQQSPIFYQQECTIKECTHTPTGKWSIPINKLENNTVYPELMIYDLEHMICGQSDKVIVTNNKIHIWDYKTDAELKYQAFSNKWVKPKKMLFPLSHLDECNINIYSIKMSLYMYMLWKANKGTLRPGDIIIEHVELERDENNDNIPILKNGKPVVKGITQINLPYRKKEVMEMLKTLKPQYAS